MKTAKLRKSAVLYEPTSIFTYRVGPYIKYAAMVGYTSSDTFFSPDINFCIWLHSTMKIINIVLYNIIYHHHRNIMSCLRRDKTSGSIAIDVEKNEFRDEVFFTRVCALINNLFVVLVSVCTVAYEQTVHLQWGITGSELHTR